MSVISNVHSVVPFDSKKSQPFDGQRLCKVIAKYTAKMAEKKAAKKQSKCVSIPVSKVTQSFLLNGLEYINAMYQDAQDGVVRELVEGGATEVRDDQLTEECVLQFLADEAAGNRITKDAANAWFDGTMAEMLTVAFADKLGVSDTPTKDQETTIAQAIGVYKEKFAGLAGGKTKYDPETAQKLIKAIETVGADDELATKFGARLQVMLKPVTVDLLGL